MAQGHRPDRVGDQIRETLSEMLARGAVHDPGIGFITITRVKVSADLQMARVFYTSMGDEKARRETARALGRATPFFRRQVGSRLQLRRVPELEFRDGDVELLQAVLDPPEHHALVLQRLRVWNMDLDVKNGNTHAPFYAVTATRSIVKTSMMSPTFTSL